MKYLVASIESFQDDQPILFEQDKVRILLTKKGDTIFAISDKCPHLGTSLMKGTIKDGVITCKSHGAQIDVETGDILEKAHIGFVKMPTKRAKKYPVIIDEGKVFVEL